MYEVDGEVDAEQRAHDAVLAAGPLVIEEVSLYKTGHGHSISMRVGSGLISTPGRGS